MAARLTDIPNMGYRRCDAGTIVTSPRSGGEAAATRPDPVAAGRSRFVGCETRRACPDIPVPPSVNWADIAFAYAESHVFLIAQFAIIILLVFERIAEPA